MVNVTIYHTWIRHGIGKTLLAYDFPALFSSLTGPKTVAGVRPSGVCRRAVAASFGIRSTTWFS